MDSISEMTLFLFPFQKMPQVHIAIFLSVPDVSPIHVHYGQCAVIFIPELASCVKNWFLVLAAEHRTQFMLQVSPIIPHLSQMENSLFQKNILT